MPFMLQVVEFRSHITLYNASCVLLHPARVPDSIRTATLRAAYDSPGVTKTSFASD